MRRIFRKVQADVAPRVAAKAADVGGLAHPAMPNIIAAQNALRMCMESIFAECMPYDQFFCGEMAARLAAYAITAAPIEDHAAMTALVQAAIPGAVANKVREGAVIHSIWETNGVEHPNVPAKGEIQ